MFKSSLLAFIIAVLYSSTVLAGTISELSKQTDVSRLEFAMFKIEQELKEELKDYYKLVGFNSSLYQKEIKPDYSFYTFATQEELFVGVIINEFMSCVRVVPNFSAEIMKELTSAKIDRIGERLMSFFSHFGVYGDINISGQNMVDYRVARLFGFHNFGKVDEENLELAHKVAEVVKIRIIAMYCSPEEISPLRLEHIYPLNADFGESKSVSEM